MDVKGIGKVTWVLKDKDGNFINQGYNDNIVVTVGRRAIAELLGGNISNFFEYIAVGTGSAGPVNGDTALSAEIVGSGLGRAIATRTYPHTGTEGHVLYSITFNISGSTTVREAGIFDSAVAGTMFSRVLVNSPNFIPVENGMALTLTWEVIFS